MVCVVQFESGCCEYLGLFILNAMPEIEELCEAGPVYGASAREPVQLIN